MEERIEDAKIQLTKKGEEQAKELGNRINNIILDRKINKEECLVLVSPYDRARKTFEIANEKVNFNLENVFILNNLREQTFAAFDFINEETKQTKFKREYEEYKRNTFKYFKQQYLGESPANVYDRTFGLLFFISKFLNAKESTKSIFIFAHGCVNKCLIMNVLNLLPEYFNNSGMADNCSIINIKNGKWNGYI